MALVISGEIAMPLTIRQSVISMIMGASLWLLAALILRYVGPLGAHDGLARFILYALVIPATVPFVYLIRWIAGLPADKTALGVALATGTALLLDGIALAWFPALYGPTIELQAGAGTAIMWGAGVAIMLGFLLNRQRND